MTLSPDLLPLLRCPDTHQPLHPARPEEIPQLQQHYVRHFPERAASPELAPSGFLLNHSRSRAYPILNNIPCLLLDEALPLSE
ncbi:MAG: hypothetical protein HC904_09680 [Blastochloris sp.]|nr:hypothetical protein [Blastochloris sp.]